MTQSRGPSREGPAAVEALAPPPPPQPPRPGPRAPALPRSAGRARRELRASGENVRRSAPGGWSQLSPQELQIAQLAAEGLSNRQIGEQLYLSHRTVESHLYRLFPKLGVTSRAQLRDALEHASSS